MSVPNAEVVIIEYAELLAAETSVSLQKKIEQGFGYDGMGLVAVRGVPEMAARRAALLPLSFAFGNLPESTLSKYVHAESMYSFGWSHGKEKLEGKPDTAKGSFYFNPIHDRPFDDAESIKAFPAFAHPNIWPEDADCPGFEAAAKSCASLVVDVGKLLARHCDAYVRSVDPTYEKHLLAPIVDVARCHKARLLYYFPFSSAPAAAPGSAAAAASGDAMPSSASAKDAAGGASAAAPTAAAVPPTLPAAAASAGGGADGGGLKGEEVSSWCGWHNDHGSLTGLTPAMFFDASGAQIPCPDPRAGLYIRTRQNATLRVSIPADCTAFQIGETAQVHTGGILQATPHCVRAAEVEGVSRGTLAVFMEPEWAERMEVPAAAEAARVLRGARGELLPPGVPQLVDRWMGPTQTFGEFTAKTLSMYY